VERLLVENKADDIVTDKPVVTNATIASVIGSILPAIMLVASAFTSWSPNDEQTAALSALTIAIFGAANAFLGKNAASKVFIPASVEKVVDVAVTEVKVEADAKVAVAEEKQAIAESFGVPHQNQGPHPLFGPVGGRLPDVPAPPPIPQEPPRA